MSWQKTRQDAKCKCSECGTTHYVVEECWYCADNPPENDSEFDEQCVDEAGTVTQEAWDRLLFPGGFY